MRLACDRLTTTRRAAVTRGPLGAERSWETSAQPDPFAAGTFAARPAPKTTRAQRCRWRSRDYNRRQSPMTYETYPFLREAH